MNINYDQLFALLEEKSRLYNCLSFIESDPISIPHKFSKKEDIEIAGFLAATIAWGNRTSIIRNAEKLMQIMDYEPYNFITKAGKTELNRLSGFVHRTYNETDALFFIESLKNIYLNHGGLERVFTEGLKQQGTDMYDAINHFRTVFLSIPHFNRTEKHIASPVKGSSAKRINMFLRWMVRKDDAGVDFGLWTAIYPSLLYCPLDIHSGNVARKLNLLTRKQNDWKAVQELTTILRTFDPSDPVKYDFALFGMGVDKVSSQHSVKKDTSKKEKVKSQPPNKSTNQRINKSTPND